MLFCRWDVFLSGEASSKRWKLFHVNWCRQMELLEVREKLEEQKVDMIMI